MQNYFNKKIKKKKMRFNNENKISYLYKYKKIMKTTNIII